MTRVAVVTGANKGIGFHVAQQLLASCTVVILACRDASRGEAAVRRLSDPKARFMQLDIGDEASIATFAAAVEQDVGRVDVLVNNAAIAFKAADPTPFAGQTEPTLKINVRGTVALTDALLPLLERSDAGRLVHVASMAGKLRQVSRKRQRDFSDPALTTEQLLGLADEFAADCGADGCAYFHTLGMEPGELVFFRNGEVLHGTAAVGAPDAPPRVALSVDCEVPNDDPIRRFL